MRRGTLARSMPRTRGPASAATIAPTLLLALAVLAIPLASAALSPGASKLDLQHVDEGRITASSRHDLDDWVRSFDLAVDFSRIGVYELSRLASNDVSVFAGQGEEFREATGTLRITLNDQGVESSLDCSLSLSETKPASAGMVEYEGAMIVTAGRGLLDDEAWDCTYGGNEVVHGGPSDVPLSSFAFAGVEGRDAGTFPAELAIMLGWADDAEDWSDEVDELAHAEAIVESGYVEAEPTLGEQSHPYSRSYDTEHEGGLVDLLLCGDVSVDDTPPTSFACAIEGEATLTVASATSAPPARSAPSAPSASSASSAPSASGAPSAPPAGSADGASENDTPAAPLALALVVVAAVALFVRRR